MKGFTANDIDGQYSELHIFLPHPGYLSEGEGNIERVSEYLHCGR